MKKLKIGILASIGGLLSIAAVLAMILAVIYTIKGSSVAVLYGLLAIPAAIGGKLLFWYTEYKI